MRPRRQASLAIVCLILCSGVACRRVDVRVNSFLSKRIALPAPTGGPIHVFAETHPRNELFEAEITTLIKRLLEDHGYVVAAESDPRPDYALACWAGTDGGSTYTGTDLYREPPHLRTTRYYTSWGERIFSHTWVPGATRHVPYSYTVFQRRLALYLYKGHMPATTQPDRAKSTLIWQATAESPGTRADLRGAVPYLLVAAFEYWGLDSGREKHVGISRKSKRVKRLIQPAYDSHEVTD